MRVVLTQLHKRGKMLYVCVITVIFIFVQQPCFCASRYLIHIGGKMTETIVGIDKLHEAKAEYEFSVDVEDCKWYLRLKPMVPDYSVRNLRYRKGKSSFSSTPDERIASSDSNSFYHVTSFSKEHIAKLIEEGIVRESDNTIFTQAERGPGSVPFAIDYRLMALWYAFASHCYFELRSNQGLIIPMETRRYEFYLTNNIYVPARWRLFNEPPRLPCLIVCSNSVDYLTPSLEEFFKSGAPNTNVYYSASKPMRVGECFVPSAAEFKYFYFDSKSTPVVNRVFAKVVLKVDSAVNKCEVKSFVPDLKSAAFFSEKRYYAKGVAVSYAITNKWPDNIEVEKAAARIAARKEYTRSVDPLKSLIWMFASITIFSVAAYFATRGRRNTNKTLMIL